MRQQRFQPTHDRALRPGLLLTLALLALAAGCADDEPQGPGVDGSPGDGSLGDGSADAMFSDARAEAGSSDAAPSEGGGSDASEASDAHTVADAADDDAASGGATCGGIAALRCADGQFCNYEVSAGGLGCDGTIADASGVCQPTPASCESKAGEVCGCDDHTYTSPCEAHRNGVSVAHPGACAKGLCDHSVIACRRAYPECPQGQVPSVQGTCYGPCVPITDCECGAASDCPEPEQYTCHGSAGHCDYYVY